MSRLYLLWSWLAFVVVVHVLPEAHTYPDWRQRVVDRVQLWLLPAAGFWAYRDAKP